MVQDNPIMNELEQLIRFCRTHDEIYIYGHDLPQRLFSKYLAMSNLPITGFLVPEINEEDIANEPFPVLNLLSFSFQYRHFLTFPKKKIGALITIEENRYNEAVSMLQKAGIKDFYFVSEWNKRTIPYKMTPRSKDNFWLEVNLADHCNLNCQCCDHFSPLASKTFLDFDQYVLDIKRLSELTDHHIGLMKLQGGEPLLNDRLIEYFRVTREEFPNTHICLFTDGLLLLQWGQKVGEQNIWEAIKKYEIEIRMTCYPIPFKMENLLEQIKEHGIEYTFDPPVFKKGARVWFFSEIGALDYKGVKHSVKHPFDLTGQQEPYRFISCYQFNESIVLRDGKIYTCPIIPYAHYFNKYFNQNLEVCKNDSIDIYKVNSYEEIAEFCTHRVPFCRYCAVQCRNSRTWKQSDHNIEEWVL